MVIPNYSTLCAFISSCHAVAVQRAFVGEHVLERAAEYKMWVYVIQRASNAILRIHVYDFFFGAIVRYHLGSYDL